LGQFRFVGEIETTQTIAFGVIIVVFILCQSQQQQHHYDAANDNIIADDEMTQLQLHWFCFYLNSSNFW
jgi:hypothetical protein